MTTEDSQHYTLCEITEMVMLILFKPVTHLKVFLRKSLSKATFERKLSDVAYTLAQVFTCES